MTSFGTCRSDHLVLTSVQDENGNTWDWPLSVCTWPSCCGIYHNLIYHFIWDLYVGACQNPGNSGKSSVHFYEGNSNDVHHPLSTTPKLFFDTAFCEHFYVPIGMMKQDLLETSDMRSVEKLHVISWWPQFTREKKNRTRTDVNLPFQCSVVFVPLASPSQ